jgi:hypothetical protein
MESGSLKLPESFGPHRPVMGMLYLYLYSNKRDVCMMMSNFLSTLLVNSLIHDPEMGSNINYLF